MNLAIYGALWTVALPFAAVKLALRAFNDARYRPHWCERFARDLPRGPFDYWIHAVSVGETRAAEPLIRDIQKRHTEARILLTHMTPTGRATAHDLFGDRVAQCYLPYDSPANARRFLDATQPRIGIVMETELWPNVIHAARAHGIPVWLANARLSEKSARGYARAQPLSRNTLNALAGILAQADSDAMRFAALGANNVAVTGNVKFDVAIPSDIAVRIARLRPALGQGPLWVAGSTREGDEAAILDVLQSHPLRRAARAVIVPRHPQRFDEVVALAQAKGFRVTRRSDVASKKNPAGSAEYAPQVDSEIVVGDSMGEMAAYYACADVVFMGGSLSTGSQNLIEPCAAGKPVVLGPSVYNFAAAADAALAAGAAVQCADVTSMLDTIHALITDRTRAEAMGARGYAFCEANRGATEKTFARIDAQS